MDESRGDVWQRPAARFAVHQAGYDHTQYGPLYWLILAPSGALVVLALVFRHEPAIAFTMLLSSAGSAFVALWFRTLRVVDEGDRLAVRFGPLPVLRRRIAYTEIVAAERDRSKVIDGWGMHFVPGRGWTYNLWGFDCVRLTLADGRTIRIGTDDPDGLAEFVRRRIGG